MMHWRVYMTTSSHNVFKKSMHLLVLFIPEMKLGERTERSVAWGRKKAGESVDFVPWKQILVWWYDRVR